MPVAHKETATDSATRPQLEKEHDMFNEKRIKRLIFATADDLPTEGPGAAVKAKIESMKREGLNVIHVVIKRNNICP